MAGIELVSDTVSAALAGATAAGGNLEPAMLEISMALLTASEFNFRHETDPLGVPWKRSKRAVDKGEQTLQDGGQLFGSLINRAGATFAEAGPELSGGDAVKAKAHQFGATIRPKPGNKALRTPFGPRASVTLPRRAFLGWTDPLIARALKILANHASAPFGVVK